MTTPKIAFSKQLETAISDGRITPTFKSNSFVEGVNASIGGEYFFLIDGGGRGFISGGADYIFAPGATAEDTWGFTRGDAQINPGTYVSAVIAMDLSSYALPDNYLSLGISDGGAGSLSTSVLNFSIDSSANAPIATMESFVNDTGGGAVDAEAAIKSGILDAAGTGEAKTLIRADVSSAAGANAIIELDCSDGIYQFNNVPDHADNATAVGAGLTTGQLYQTSGVLKIVT